MYFYAYHVIIGVNMILSNMSSNPIVSLVKSEDHYNGTKNALSLIIEHIAESIKGKENVLIKPNFVSTRRQLAATHVDSVKAVLDVITHYYDETIIIGEGPAIGNLQDGITNFDYETLKDDYDVRFVDLNEDDYLELEGVNRSLDPIKFRFSKTLLESDYLISIAKPKTHDCVIATLSLKNVVVGSLVSKREKERIHQGTKAININLALLGKECIPNLGVVDGLFGMEGAGPVSGEPVELGLCGVSLYPVSLDAVMAKVMGFEPLEIGYLYYLNDWAIGVADVDQIKVIGEPISKVSKKFKPHPTYREQCRWK